jgi:hypothetical protein
LIAVFARQCRAAKYISAPYLLASIEFELMVAMESIEKLKQQYTDKYVVVDATVPELARFRSAVGQVKTVNMNGRALVEFDQWANIGWYDIELDFLKVVPKPAEAKKAPEKAAEKPAAAKPSAAKPEAAKPAAAAPAAGKQSTADILAAARAKKGAAPAAKAAPADKPAAAKPAAAGKPSTADILAAARGKAPAASAAPAAKKPEPKPAAPEPAEEPADVPVVQTPVAKAEPAKKAAGGAKPTTTAEKIAYCRKVDAKT